MQSRFFTISNILSSTLLITLLAFSSGAHAALPDNVDGQLMPSLAPLVEKTAPAVVNIRTKAMVAAQNNPLMQDPFFRRFFGVPEGQGQQQEREVSAAGSGVIIDAKKGLLLTNHHVIEDATEIKVYLNDDRAFDAVVVGSDPGTDIAVLRIENPENLTDMPLGNSEKLRVGDFVVAIGNPFGLQHTVTSGIVSALGRQGIQRDGYEDFIQTDASINPGNSGGALINLKGELVGINSAIYSSSGGNIGIGFAIPVSIAKSIMAQIIEFGEVKRGMLGVSIRDFNAETAEALGIDTDNYQGAMIEEIVPDSPAENTGLEVGDIIIAIDDQKISSAGDLRTTIGLKRSGDSVKITVNRNNTKKNFTTTLGMLNTTPVVAAGDIHPGLAGAEFSGYKSGSQPYKGKGVQIDSVAPGSPAEFRGLQANDVITQVNQVPVTTVADLQKTATNQSLLVMKIHRGNRTLLRTIR
ncbi:MAG: DegQ family serine endoprotease [Gammaproteobacteria bacterium]|nr:DegQ family serine endoprotease [Gammaproteobacteria bacterium]